MTEYLLNPELNLEPEMGLAAPPDADWDYLNKTVGGGFIIDNNGQLKQRPMNKSTFDNLYNEGKRLKIPYNTLMAIMTNVALESGGHEDQRQIDWNHKKGTPWRYLPNGGVGLIQFTGQAIPKNQRQYLYNSILNPYHPQTNYWGGRDTYRSGLQRGIYNLNDSITYYRKYFVRPGKPNYPTAYKIGQQFSKMYKKYDIGGLLPGLRLGGMLISRKFINNLKHI